MGAKNKLKNSTKYKDVYITKDYARAIQMERKILIKAMFKAKEKGLNAIVENLVSTLTTSRWILNHLNQFYLLIIELLVLLPNQGNACFTLSKHFLQSILS